MGVLLSSQISRYKRERRANMIHNVLVQSTPYTGCLQSQQISVRTLYQIFARTTKEIVLALGNRGVNLKSPYILIANCVLICCKTFATFFKIRILHTFFLYLCPLYCKLLTAIADPVIYSLYFCVFCTISGFCLVLKKM